MNKACEEYTNKLWVHPSRQHGGNMKPRAIMHGNTALARRFILNTDCVFDWICFFDRDKEKAGFFNIPTYSDLSMITDMEFDWIFCAVVDVLGVQQEYVQLYHVPMEKIRSIKYVHQLPKYKLFSSIANEIYRKGIAGSIAELGVNWGDTSKQINMFFHDRKLYCFDTFSGFSANDENSSEIHSETIHNKKFDNPATPEAVLRKMPYPDLCVIKEGYFPESLNGLEDKFSFVHIDCDLYKPITEGLLYFYPRLSVGGYICVHDYFNESFPGARKAIHDFCDGRNISFVPVEEYGGVVIIKGY